LAGNIAKKKLDVNDSSFAHFTLLLSLHYFVKFGSLSFAIYNNKLILSSTVSATLHAKNY